MLLRLDGEGPLHRQVYLALRAAIVNGDLPTGARLASTRGLAQDLAVSRTTVQQAYDQLLAEGYVEGRVGSGTYVTDAGQSLGAMPALVARASSSPRWSAAAQRVMTVRPLLTTRATMRERPRFDFRHGLPALGDFPQRRWRRYLARSARRSAVDAYDYGPAGGVPELREAIAGYLRRSRGLVCDAERVLVTNGSQQGLDLIARLLLDPGDRVLMEEPGYEGARHAFVFAGAEVQPVAVDAEGLDIATAPKGPARLVYVTPSHQYPLGSVLSLARRAALLQWAQRQRAFVIEDDYNGEYRFSGRPLAPLQALDPHGCVIYLGTFSKVLFPALRLGYLVLPGDCVATFLRAKALADGGTSALEQGALAELIGRGDFESHLRRTRNRIRERRAALLESVARHLGERVEVVGADAGLHVMLRLHGWSVAAGHALARRAAAEGVGVYPATTSYLKPPRHAELLLGYAALNIAQIRLGIRRLGELVAAGPDAVDGMTLKVGERRR